MKTTQIKLLRNDGGALPILIALIALVGIVSLYFMNQKMGERADAAALKSEQWMAEMHTYAQQDKFYRDEETKKQQDQIQKLTESLKDLAKTTDAASKIAAGVSVAQTNPEESKRIGSESRDAAVKDVEEAAAEVKSNLSRREADRKNDPALDPAIDSTGQAVSGLADDAKKDPQALVNDPATQERLRKLFKDVDDKRKSIETKRRQLLDERRNLAAERDALLQKPNRTDAENAKLAELEGNIDKIDTELEKLDRDDDDLEAIQMALTMVALLLALVALALGNPIAAMAFMSMATGQGNGEGKDKGEEDRGSGTRGPSPPGLTSGPYAGPPVGVSGSNQQSSGGGNGLYETIEGNGGDYLLTALPRPNKWLLQVAHKSAPIKKVAYLEMSDVDFRDMKRSLKKATLLNADEVLKASGATDSLQAGAGPKVRQIAIETHSGGAWLVMSPNHGFDASIQKAGGLPGK